MTKFQIGEWVSIARVGAMPTPPDPCRVVHVLSRERGPQQYRVKCSAESFERIVDEVRLSASNAPTVIASFADPR